MPDDEVRIGIERRLAADADLDARDIRVRVVDGVATLEGTVPEIDDVRRALRHAGRADGVRQIVNRLRIVERAGGEQQPPGVRAP